MKILPILLLLSPVFLFGQGHVGIGTITPDHPFQVNVDSAYLNFALDQQQLVEEDSLMMEEGQSILQTFLAGQTGHLAKISIHMGLPVFEVVLLEVYRGAGPYGVQIANGEVSDSSGVGIVELILASPLPALTAGETLHVIVTPLIGSNSWKHSLGNTYSGGHAQFFNGSMWSPLSYDMVFRTFLEDMDTASVSVLTVRSNGSVGVKDYLLPIADGAAGEVITTNGEGSLSWADPVTLGQYDEIIDADSDTRISVEESPDEDAIRLYTAGSLKLLMTSPGNIGVGTSVPAGRLHLRHLSSPESPHLHLMEYVYDAYSRIKFSNQIFADIDWQIKAKPDDEATDSRFQLYYTNGGWTGNKLTILGTGSVAIGPNDPMAKLDIQASGLNQHVLRFSTERPWEFRQAYFGDSSALSLQSAFPNTAFEIASWNGVNVAARFVPGSSSKISLVPDGGEIGIGLLEAAAKVHVRHNSSTADVHLRLTETSANDFARIKFETESDPGIFWDIAAKAHSSPSESKLNFYYGNPGFTGDKMTITGEGNVGIGTTSPGNRLRINGSSTSSQHVFSAGTNYAGNVQIRAIEGFSLPATGYGIGGYFSGGFKGVEAFSNGGSFGGTVFGIEGYATGSSGVRIGVYGWASGGATNWAGRFGQGNVWIENNAQIDGNVGVGITTPATDLDVAGKIKIGDNADTPQAGMIRWNTATQNFEGYDGSTWHSFTLKGASGGWGKINLIAQENEQATSSDGNVGDQFGTHVSISGNYAIIGAPNHNTSGQDNMGKAYIFFYNGAEWQQQAILTSSDGVEMDNFGQSVSIDGSYAIVGAPKHHTNGNNDQGKAYVYSRNGTTWTQQAILTASDGAEYDLFGISVSISGTFAILGANGCNVDGQLDRGKAYIFERIGSAWSEYDILTASDGAGSDAFGTCVSISGAYAVVGAPLHNTNGNLSRGKAYVFAWNGSEFPQQAIIISNDGWVQDFFGTSVSISDNYIIIGAKGHDTNGDTDKGKAYIYNRNGSTWPQTDILVAEEGLAKDNFGNSVSIQGNYVIVGANQPGGSNSNRKGKVFVFARNGTIWNAQAILKAADGDFGDTFGGSIAIGESHIVVGAPFHAALEQNSRGKIYFFTKD